MVIYLPYVKRFIHERFKCDPTKLSAIWGIAKTVYSLDIDLTLLFRLN